jgi:hypothetical protein
MGTGPGGSFDLYGRTIGPHLSKHIPGNPTIIMEHMPGAGGVIAGNHIYSIAPQDGTKMLLSHAITLAEKLEPTGVRFETAKMQWLGAYDAITRARDVAHRAGAEHRGSQDQGRRGDRLVCPRAPDLLLGRCSRTRSAPGTRSSPGCAPATTTTSPWSAAKSRLDRLLENLNGTRPTWDPEKKVNLLVQFTTQRKPYLKTSDAGRALPPDKRDVAEFVISGTPVSRAIALGPGVPADRVAALRKAFEETMKDPAFLADCEKRKLAIEPTPHRELHAMIVKIVSAPPELVTRVKKAIGKSSSDAAPRLS